MNDKKRGGFIPIIAVIIIGLAAVAGGTAATVSIIKNKERPTQPAPQEVKQSEKQPIDGAVRSEIKNGLAANIAPESIEPRLSEAPKEENGGKDARGKESIYQELVDRIGRPSQEEVEKKQEQVQAEYESMNAALRKAAEDYQKHAQEMQAEAQKDKYAENATYPIILSFEDSKGNVYKRSSYNEYSGPYAGWPNESSRTIHLGDTIRATVTAKDPQGRTLEYNWNSNSQPFNAAKGIENGAHKYASSNVLEYTITNEDLRSAGETFRLVWQVRVAGNVYYRFGGGQYDDSGFIDYKILP